MLSCINVLGIEGPNYLVFYKIKQACDLFSCLPTFNTFSLLVILNAPVHNKLAFLYSLSSRWLSYMVQESVIVTCCMVFQS